MDFHFDLGNAGCFCLENGFGLLLNGGASDIVNNLLVVVPDPPGLESYPQ